MDTLEVWLHPVSLSSTGTSQGVAASEQVQLSRRSAEERKNIPS